MGGGGGGGGGGGQACWGCLWGGGGGGEQYVYETPAKKNALFLLREALNYITETLAIVTRSKK